MPIINGTTYHEETPDAVIRVLENYRISRDSRLSLYYGDQQTGQAWGDIETGYIGRSTGTVKIPLCIHNRRSMGGGGILDHCIVRIETARGKRILWKHPNYSE